jgi:cytoskeletal protein CcmA (bactofilin family)
MRYDCSLVAVPQSEKDVDEFNWANFPPSQVNSEGTRFAIVDECSGISGKLISSNTFIHGQVDGLVFAENVTVEKTGLVRGIIFCRTLIIHGSVFANIICDGLAVRRGGILSGTLKYRQLKIDAEGQVAGKFERRGGPGGDAAAAVPPYAKSKSL